MEPLLGPVGSLQISGDFCLELRNPIFGGPQLMRELLRDIKRVSAVLLSNDSGSLHQIHNCAARCVELITEVCRAFSSMRKWDTSDSLLLHL